MKIEAYKCTECNSIHQVKKDATACIRKCKSTAKKKAKEIEIAKMLIELRNYARLNATSISHFEELVSDAATTLWGGEFSIKFDVKYYDHISNSHEAPMGLSTNWCARDKDQPTGYPGFQGNFKYTSKGCKKLGFWGNEYFDKWNGITGINVCNASVKLFLQDFPLIEANMVQYKKLQEQAKIDTNTLTNLLKVSISTDDTVKTLNAEIESSQLELYKLQESLVDMRAKREAHIDLKYRDDILHQKLDISLELKEWVKLNIGDVM